MNSRGFVLICAASLTMLLPTLSFAEESAQS